MATPAAQARKDAGLTQEAAAKLAGVSAGYVGKVERSGGCPIGLAMRLARIYKCNATVFIYSNKGNAKSGKTRKQANSKKA